MRFGDDIADPFTSPYIKFHKPSKEEEEEEVLRSSNDSGSRFEDTFCMPICIGVTISIEARLSLLLLIIY
jgi:hypothetical protein